MPQTADAEAEQLTFDPATHIYMKGGLGSPSVPPQYAGLIRTPPAHKDQRVQI